MSPEGTGWDLASLIPPNLIYLQWNQNVIIDCHRDYRDYCHEYREYYRNYYGGGYHEYRDIFWLEKIKKPRGTESSSGSTDPLQGVNNNSGNNNSGNVQFAQQPSNVTSQQQQHQPQPATARGNILGMPRPNKGFEVPSRVTV